MPLVAERYHNYGAVFLRPLFGVLAGFCWGPAASSEARTPCWCCPKPAAELGCVELQLYAVDEVASAASYLSQSAAGLPSACDAACLEHESAPSDAQAWSQCPFHAAVGDAVAAPSEGL